MLSQVYVFGPGMGDAIRMAAIVRQRRQPDARQVAFVEDGFPNALALLRNLTFVDTCIPTPAQFWRHFPAEALRPCLEFAPFGGPLPLAPSDLRLQERPAWLDAELPASYAVAQPSTSLHKIHVGEPRDLGLPVVLLGSEKDRALVDWPGAIDLRGRLTVEESMLVVSGCAFAFGVDSWVAHLAGALGKPGIQVVRPITMTLYGASWAGCWPTITLEVGGKEHA